jgi:hypothetical protein
MVGENFDHQSGNPVKVQSRNTTRMSISGTSLRHLFALAINTEALVTGSKTTLQDT